jgi:VCBS repeat-containing protein
MPTNTNPLALDDDATANAVIGAILTAPAPGVLTNDSDPDGNALSITQVASVSSGATGLASSAILGGYGSLTLNSDGSYSYTVTDLTGPTGSHLLDAFTYTVIDGQGGTASAELDISLNRGPLATNDAVEVGIGRTVQGNVLTNDSDPDGDMIHVTGIGGSNSWAASERALRGTRPECGWQLYVQRG